MIYSRKNELNLNFFRGCNSNFHGSVPTSNNKRVYNTHITILYSLLGKVVFKKRPYRNEI